MVILIPPSSFAVGHASLRLRQFSQARYRSQRVLRSTPPAPPAKPRAGLTVRVETHSESFRPLPVTADRLFTRLESEPELGVLPPRAEPAILPDNP